MPWRGAHFWFLMLSVGVAISAELLLLPGWFVRKVDDLGLVFFLLAYYEVYVVVASLFPLALRLSRSFMLEFGLREDWLISSLVGKIWFTAGSVLEACWDIVIEGSCSVGLLPSKLFTSIFKTFMLPALAYSMDLWLSCFCNTSLACCCLSLSKSPVQTWLFFLLGNVTCSLLAIVCHFFLHKI